MNDTKKPPLIFFPLFILLFLIVTINILSITKAEELIRPNTFLVIGVILIILGLVVGTTTIIRTRVMTIILKLFFLLLYIPIVLFSLLIIGL